MHPPMPPNQPPPGPGQPPSGALPGGSPGPPPYGPPQGQPPYGPPHQPGPQPPAAAMYVPLFFMRQRITMMVNQYEIHAGNPDGTQGPLLAFAQQKRMAFKEQVTFYADTAKTQPVFSFKARRKLDLNAGYDVYDAAGMPMGMFRKDFKASLLRSSWHLQAPGVDAFGTERNQTIAILRRVWELIPYLGDIWIPFVFHFDFTDKQTGRPVLTSERKRSIRDRYIVNVPDQQLDFRVAASMAVALDALQSR